MLFIYLSLKVSLPKDIDITMDGVETEHIGVHRPTSPIPLGKIQASGQGIKLYSSSSWSHFRMGLTPTLHPPAFWYGQAHAQHWTQSITTLPQINPFKYLQPSATEKMIPTQRTKTLYKGCIDSGIPKTWIQCLWLTGLKVVLWMSSKEKWMPQKVRFFECFLISKKGFLCTKNAVFSFTETHLNQSSLVSTSIPLVI